MAHEAGDLLIQAMADCSRYNAKDNMLAMRYGCDEFVLFGSFTSIGGAGYKAVKIEDLSVLIELADQSMYTEKRRKKELKNKNDSQDNRE